MMIGAMTFIQHVPSFVDNGGVARKIEFAALEELLADPWIASWTRDDGFYRFSKNRVGQATMMMAEHDAGARWWVMGYLKGDGIDALKLPQWLPQKASAPVTDAPASEKKQ
jgi:hypothetical protein